MKRIGMGGALALVLMFGASVAIAQEKPSQPSHETEVKHAPGPTTPEWKRLESLVGEWDGYMQEGNKKYPSHLSIRMTGDGSALMHWMDQGTPHEMVTMFHPDGKDLLATHYCAAHNQPRLKMASASSPNQLAFNFKDGTNIGLGDGYMSRLVVTFVDPDHHTEEWTYTDKGKPMSPAVFYYTRKK